MCWSLKFGKPLESQMRSTALLSVSLRFTPVSDVKGTRKLELFGRSHNVHPGWITLGNQLGSTRLLDPILKEKYQGY